MTELYKSQVVSIPLYGYWNLDSPWYRKKRIHAFEKKCLRRLIRIFHWEQKTNNNVPSKVKSLLNQQGSILVAIKRSHCLTDSPRTSCNWLLEGRLNGEDNASAGQATTKSWRIWQCQKSWEPPSTDHCRGSYLFLLSLGLPCDWW